MCKAMFVSLVLVLCSLVGADKSVTAAGVTVKVKGQSGKMTLTVPTANEPMDVECQMVALRQLDAGGTTLGAGGSEKHSFNSFATQSFTISEPMKATYEGLATSKVSFESTLVGSSKLKIDTMIFTEAGSFSVGDDKVNVTAGTVKFNVEMSSWSWCGAPGVTCKNNAGEGDSVELDISIAATGKGSPSSKAGNAYDIGGGKELLMLNTFSTDGGSTWTAMPTGYPKVSGSQFTLKFPKWNGTVTYDPVVTSVDEGGAFTVRFDMLVLLLATVCGLSTM